MVSVIFLPNKLNWEFVILHCVHELCLTCYYYKLYDIGIHLGLLYSILSSLKKKKN